MNTWWLLGALVIAGIWMSALQRRIEKLEKRNDDLDRIVGQLMVHADKVSAR